MKKLDKLELISMYQTEENKHPEFSLDQRLYAIFEQVKEDQKDSFENFRTTILEANQINEYDYYTKNVDFALKEYVEKEIFPQYEKNDKAHGIIHIREVIRRSFALNDTLKLNLNHNLIYAIASYHDLGKYIDHENHEKIAAEQFISDHKMEEFFTDEQRKIIMEAIQDHRSSKEDTPRTIYGKLISSADRNTRIYLVFVRSFFVGKWRTPDMRYRRIFRFYL